MSKPNKANRGVQIRRWFDHGYTSFSRTFPEIAKTINPHPFYVCPQCLRPFDEGAISTGLLTREDVPPKSLGGRKIILTCGDCNWPAGHDMDVHARREADIFEFFGGRLSGAQATIRTKSGRLPIHLSSTNKQVTMLGVAEATSPADNNGIKADLNQATLPNGWQDLNIKIQFKPFSAVRAEASWVRTAYLVFFAALGYRFVIRPELDEVRKRIYEPGAKAMSSFRIVRREPVDVPMLTVIRSPETFRSFAMVYGQQVVFLPLYGDSDLYRRLDKQAAGHVELSANGVFPWPDRPMFLHDQL